MMRRYLITITLLIVSQFLLSAQESDSLYVSPSDSAVAAQEHHAKVTNILKIAAPVTLITYGIVSLSSDRLQRLDHSTRGQLVKDNSLWNNSWDDYVQFTPAIAAFGMKLGGIESRHDLSDMTILYVLSNLLETGVVFTTKHYVTRQRPSGPSISSFPSGHTATAFAAAEFLNQEYGGKSALISIGGYAFASFIGVSRVYNDAHWISDVVAGAGIGILSTKIVYWAYPYLQKIFHKKDQKFNAFVCPTYNDGQLGLSISCVF